MHCIAGKVAERLGLEPVYPKHLWAWEWDKQCQQELEVHPSRPACLFGDIGEAYHEKLTAVIEKAQAQKIPLTYNLLKPVIMTEEAIRGHAWCHFHQRYCMLKETDHHTAGTSSTQWSPMGKGGDPALASVSMLCICEVFCLSPGCQNEL